MESSAVESARSSCDRVRSDGSSAPPIAVPELLTSFYVDNYLAGASLLLAAGKFTLDQVVGCVLWQAAYLTISEPYRNTLQAFIAEQQQQILPQSLAMVAAC